MSRSTRFGRKAKLILGMVLTGGALCLAAFLLKDTTIAVLSPQGHIAQKELNLIIFASVLSLVVVVPVFIMTFWIAWKYRASNTKAKYTPDWDHSRLAETIWWVVPLLLIIVLSIITWRSSHELDPNKAIASDTKPLTIQVVALQWKWLFIYPEQHIATVNYVQFPEKTSVHFQITADAPMNSFWIPRLGGQIYAMSGMSTQLHLMASEPGTFQGSSANLSGEGFAGMHFVARASSHTNFDAWVQKVKQKPHPLNIDEYNTLAEPSQNNKPNYYSSYEPDLYGTIIEKFMGPQHNMSGMEMDEEPSTHHTQTHGMDEE